MDFIIDEAEVSDEIYSKESDCSDNECLLDDFIKPDNAREDIDSATFYRNFENRLSFQNQQKNISKEIDKNEQLFYGTDDQPEMFAPEDFEHIELYNFKDYKKKADEFKNTLLHFQEISAEKNHLFYSVVYALAYLKNNRKPSDFNSAISIIGQDKFLKLKEIEKETMLDYTQFVFFERCMILNNVLAAQFGHFLRFYERRNKFRYQLRQKLKTKNEMKAELSACVIQKFNGYDLLRVELNRNEKKNLIPIDFVYEPTLDKNKPIYCYFAPKIHLAFQTFYGRFIKGTKKTINFSAAKQCPYCNNFFLKSEKKMQEHILCFSGQAGISFAFDNGKIINYQDNFNKIGDLPFAVYYDFETTTGSAVFFDAKMYVISYCIVVAFHLDLNLPHMFIYRSYDQTKDDLESMENFSVVQNNFFKFQEYYNLKTLKQLQDAVLAVCNRSRETALA